jgi:hypothetical protein
MVTNRIREAQMNQYGTMVTLNAEQKDFNISSCEDNLSPKHTIYIEKR